MHCRRAIRGNAMIAYLTDFLWFSWDILIDATRGMLWPAVFFLLLGLLVKGRALFADMARAMAEASLNVQIMVFNLIFVVPLITVCSIALIKFVRIEQFTLIPVAAWDTLPAAMVIFLGICAGDFVGYWRHRLEHTPLLWPSHAVHHSDTEMTWLALERFHPINRFTTFAVDTTALLLLGLPPYAVVACNLFRHYYGYFIHADLPWTYGPLGKIFVSPAMHRWHHAADVQAFNTNYATVFALFDRIFGTWRMPGPCTAPLGVTDDMAPTLVGQLAYPFTARAYRNLWRRLRKTA